MIKTLQKEFNYFTSLLPVEFQEEFKKNAYICGGAIYCLHNNKEPVDYDFFCRDVDFTDRIKEYFKSYTTPFKNLLQGKHDNMVLLITKYAISLGKYQIVTKYVGEPELVVSQFDFKHNCYWYDPKYENINQLYGWGYLNSNKLIFNDDRVRDISGTIMRIPKFVSRGMTITKKEIAKMLSKLEDNGFDESEHEILHDYTSY